MRRGDPFSAEASTLLRSYTLGSRVPGDERRSGARVRAPREGADMTLARRLIRDERGQDLAEYAIALAVITIAGSAPGQPVGRRGTTLWNRRANGTAKAAR